MARPRHRYRAGPRRSQRPSPSPRQHDTGRAGPPRRHARRDRRALRGGDRAAPRARPVHPVASRAACRAPRARRAGDGRHGPLARARATRRPLLRLGALPARSPPRRGRTRARGGRPAQPDDAAPWFSRGRHRAGGAAPRRRRSRASVDRRTRGTADRGAGAGPGRPRRGAAGGPRAGRVTTAVITGAGGLVGRHLATHLADTHRVLALGHAELDVTNADAVRTMIVRERPALILSCAVLQVDECERDPVAAEAVNVTGPRLLAGAATEVGAEIVHLSSNYVFDGAPTVRRPYTVDDLPNPINVYGRTKLAGERAVLAACARSYVIRTSWVFGPGKTSFVGTAHRQLRDGRPLRAVADVWASTTSVVDLVARTREVLARGHHGLYHVVNAGVCSHLDFAREAARLVGLSDTGAAG